MVLVMVLAALLTVIVLPAELRFSFPPDRLMAPEAEPKVMLRKPCAVEGPVMVPADKPSDAVPKWTSSAVVMVVLALAPVPAGLVPHFL